jgi:hypothetical protein
MKKKNICGNCKYLDFRLKKMSLAMCINTSSIYFRLFQYKEDESCEFFENKLLSIVTGDDEE